MYKAAEWPDIKRVAERMCERHARAACALSFSDDPVEAVAGLATRPLIGVTIWSGGEPQVAVGAVLTHPNVASTFLYGVEGWNKTALIDTTRFLKKYLRRALTGAGVRRVSVLAPWPCGPQEARWKHYLGCRYETLLRAYGKGGEDFALFVAFL